jgi:hypothetical protein
MKKTVRTMEFVWESESTLVVRRRQTITRSGNNETDGPTGPTALIWQLTRPLPATAKPTRIRRRK